MPSIFDKLNQVNWDFPNSNTSENINSIHPYPAKFIQEIPKTLIQTIGVPKGTWIFDPFCGSGATLVEAQLAGIPSIGIDLNPIACLISRVKTQTLDSEFMKCALSAVKHAKESGQVVIPPIPNLDHWFKQDIQQAIARLLIYIEHEENESIKEALRLSLSSILVRVSYQDSDTRYAAIEKNIDARKFYILFLSTAERLWNIKAAYKPLIFQAKIMCKDILQVMQAEINNPIGLVVTSPPYPNAYEYWLYHKYRMFWLGYDPIQVKNQEIGARAHYFKKNYPTEQDFHDQMFKVFLLFKDVVIKHGYVCIVIGRSMIHGKIIDNASILIDIAHELGFTPIANISRQIASSRKTFNLSHANIKTENLLIFKK